MDDLADQFRQFTTPEFIQSLKLADDMVVWADGLAYYARDRKYRVIVPPELRDGLLNAVHRQCHAGRKRTYALLRREYFWPGMPADVADHIRRCDQCQQSKPLSAKKRPIAKYPRSDRFKTVHIDIVGPLPVSRRGNRFLVTMMDRFTRWFDAIPVRNCPTGEDCAGILFTHWFARFGLPQTLISDQGAQFEGQVFSELLKLAGVKHARTNPYRPQTNGLIERQHRVMKEALAAHCEDRKEMWEDALGATLYGLRVAPGEDGYTPAELVYGEQLAIPGLLVDQELGDEDTPTSAFAKNLHSEIKLMRRQLLTADDEKQDQRTVGPAAYPHTHVFMQRPVYKGAMRYQWEGPYRVLSYRWPTIVIDRKGKERRVNLSQVKPCWSVKPRHPHGEEPEEFDLILEVEGEPHHVDIRPRSRIPVRVDTDVSPRRTRSQLERGTQLTPPRYETESQDGSSTTTDVELFDPEEQNPHSGERDADEEPLMDVSSITPQEGSIDRTPELSLLPDQTVSMDDSTVKEERLAPENCQEVSFLPDQSREPTRSLTPEEQQPLPVSRRESTRRRTGHTPSPPTALSERNVRTPGHTTSGRMVKRPQWR